MLPGHLTLVASGVRRTITDGGCIVWPLRAALNGRVSGSVRGENGVPLYGIQVELVPVDPTQARVAQGHPQSRVGTNNGGEFEFSAMPPGSYWLGINLRNPPSSGAPYPPTYFPGTTNRDEAQPIVIGQGTQHDGFNFLLNAPLAHWRIEIQIDTGSESQSNVYVCYSQAGRAIGSHTRRYNEPFFFDVVDGEEYQVSVHADIRAGHLHAESTKFIATAGQTRMTLKATRASRPHASASPCEMR